MLEPINYHINMGQSCFQPFPTPVFDCFQYVPQTIKSGGGEGLGTRLGLDSDPWRSSPQYDHRSWKYWMPSDPYINACT